MLAAAVLLLAQAQDPPAPDIPRERTSLLRHALKPHAAFLGFDRETGRVRLRTESDGKEQAWPLDPDAEIRVRGGWGGIEDLGAGERVWAWVRVDRQNAPRAVFMIADEISEQDIHQVPWTLVSHEAAAGTVALRRKLDAKTEQNRTLKLRGAAAVPAAGAAVYVQTAGDEVVRMVSAEGLSKLKEAQRALVEERWRRDGLPGTVTGLHLLSGEVEVTLDHEGIRWGRSLKAGDAVTLNLEKPVRASVLEARPWYERTRVTLVSIGRDLADVSAGRRLRLSMKEPSAELRASRLPLDADRPREAAARAEWMLASTYCGCSVAGDVCTGMFYTLAACNTMTCGMPNQVRGFVRPLIEKGMTDREIFEKMEEKFGASIWKPHLLR